MANKRILIKEDKILSWKILLLAAAVFVSYFPVMNFEFVNWDDNIYIMNNNMITAFNWANLKMIFSSYFVGNYHPFTLLSFAFDFHFFKLSAPGYHVHNLILHLVNAMLVYSFFFHLLKKNSTAAVVIALLFALHPMHVESVAWVSERKDLLYTAWFFMSLITYLFYLQKGKKIFYLLSLLFFLFSCLSKAQAVTLPIVLILTDYFSGRRFGWKTAVEKIPFFLLSITFGIVAIFAQKASNYINPLGIPIFQSLFYAPYSLCVYLLKFVVPAWQTALYEYPVTQDGGVPLYIYLSPLILPILIIAIWKSRKNGRYISFGLLFFLATIFPVLQFLPVGRAVVAERYTYIPYIGLGLIVVTAFLEFRQKLSLKKKNIANTVGIALMVFMAVTTWNRTLAWKDSISLWTDVIDKNPQCAQAFTNRAFMYNEKMEYDNAVNDLTEGLKIDSTDAKRLNFYASRAFLYKKMGRFELALSDYSSAIRKNPGDVKLFFARGVLYTDNLEKYDSGISDFKRYLRSYPDDNNCNMNLGIAYYYNSKFDSAVTCFLKSVELNPANGKAHSMLATIFCNNRDYTRAYEHLIQAKQCGDSVDNTLMIFLKSKVENK